MMDRSHVACVGLLLASALTAGCTPTGAEQLAKEWECGSTLTLTFTADGNYRIESSATRPHGIWTGQYTVTDNQITVSGEVAHPLDRYTTVYYIEPRNLVLSTAGGDQFFCSTSSRQSEN